MAGFTGLPRRASTVALVALVAAQLGQTLVDSHAWLVVLTALGSLAALATLISIPVVSQLLGCTPSTHSAGRRRQQPRLLRPSPSPC